MFKMMQKQRRTIPLYLTLIFAALLSACGGSEAPVKQQVSVMAAPPAAAPAANVVEIPGSRNSYAIKRTIDSFSLTDKGFIGGVTMLSPTQTSVKFSDFTVNLLVGDKSKTISEGDLQSLIELYIAFFNRVPDANGMVYWIDQIKGGKTIAQLATNFYDAALLYSDITHYRADMSDGDFVRIIYKNVLSRDTVDKEGYDYWTGALSKPAGTLGAETRATLINTIINSAHTFKGDATYGWVADLLDNKIIVGTYFSIQQGLNYNTEQESISNGVSIAAAVTPTDISAAKTRIGVTDAALNLTTAAPLPPKVTLSTSMGDIVVALNPDRAPITVTNFLRYTDSGFYSNKIFHRVISNFMIQGGGFTSDLGQASTYDPIKLEVNKGMSNIRGSIAMARTSVLDSATSQFYINVVDNVFLDTSGGGYAVFGNVISGMDVVDKIKAVPTATRNGMGDVPVTAVVILSAKRTQ